MRNRGLCVEDLKSALGLSAPQAVYKWLRGEGLPSIDNLFALSKLIDIPIDEILIEEGLEGNSHVVLPCVFQQKRQAVSYYFIHGKAA